MICRLLFRELDIETYRLTVGLKRSLVCGLHDTSAPAGNNRIAKFANDTSGKALGYLRVWVIGLKSGRTEKTYRFWIIGYKNKTIAKLFADSLDSLPNFLAEVATRDRAGKIDFVTFRFLRCHESIVLEDGVLWQFSAESVG